VLEADARLEGFGRVGEADGCAERLALLVALLVVEGLVVTLLVLEGPAFDGRAAAEAEALDRGAVGHTFVAAAVGRGLCPAGDVAGPNVATDSIAPATRHTARMLASSGMTVPCPAKGPASRRSRLRRRFARSSR
jgi:hypothetical protein